jgi:hypothetical protein
MFLKANECARKFGPHPDILPKHNNRTRLSEERNEPGDFREADKIRNTCKLKSNVRHDQNPELMKPTTDFTRTKENPLPLKTPPGTSGFTMHADTKDGLPILVCTVGKTVLHYDARCIQDLHAMLKAYGDWMELGGADEQKPAKDGTVEAWGRSPKNPVGGWYGLKKGLRGRFGVYLPPLMEALGLCELEHNPKNNRIRAK